MARWFSSIALMLRLGLIGTACSVAAHAQITGAMPPPLPAAPPPEYAEPPEEDESVATPKTYIFNPLQAKKEIETGDFYARRGNLRGAAMRYREATLWDDGSMIAFFKWGETSEKLKDYGTAREAFEAYLKLESDAKKLAQVTERLKKYPAKPGIADVDRTLDLEQAKAQERNEENKLRQKGFYPKP